MHQRTSNQRPTTVGGTKRQTVTAADGTPMQRQYVYLQPSEWAALQEKARITGTSVSQVIATLAASGTDKSKGNHDRSQPRN